MIKSDLIWRIRQHSPHLLHQEVETVVHAILDEITATLARGDRVELRGSERFLSRFVKLALAVIPGRVCSSRFQKGLPLTSRPERR